MSDPFYLSQEWKAIRRQVLKRDGYQCRVFSCTVGGSANLTVHHIVPRAEGGGNHRENLITLCPHHHDEIEVAGIRVVALIEAWESESPHTATDMSSIILDALGQNGRAKANRPSQNIAIKAPEPKGHICESSTVEALSLFRQGRTLAATAKALGFSPMYAATISAILKRKPGAISAQGEAKLRRRLQLRTPATMMVERSEHIPATIHTAKVIKRQPPKRTTPAPKSAPTQPPKVTQRSSTSLHVTLSDIELFDAIAGITGMRKAALFGEMVRFYAKANDLHFLSPTEDDEDDKYWRLYDSAFDLLCPPGPGRLEPKMLLITDLLIKIGLAEGVTEITRDELDRWRKDMMSEGTTAFQIASSYTAND